MKQLSIVLLLLSLTLVLANAQTTFKNPIITGLASDPSICRVGDDYYLVTSTFEYFPGLPIYQSKDLVNWKMIGYALHKSSQNPLMGCEASVGGQYAATLRYDKGIFYVICTNYGGQGSQGEFYVTATNPAGPWSEPHWLNYWYVDPSLLFENDSTYYLSPDNNGSFLVGTLNQTTDKFNKPLKKVASGLGGSSPEGPHLYKINDYYYIMSAEGGTGYQHREVIQRSKSPYGPYVASPINPVASHMNAPNNPFQAIGHADLVQLPDSSWWLVCLGFRPKGGNYHHLGRETFLAPITWSADGWPKVGTDGIIKESYAVPNLPQHIWEKEPVRDEFNTTTLPLAWNFIRNPHASDWSLTEKPGSLRLNGSKISFKEKDSPTFVGRRQTAFNLVASTKINFTPTKPNEEAGLVVRGDDKNHFDFTITQMAGKRVVLLRKYLKDQIVGLNYKDISDGDLVLRISATDIQYQFWIQQEGKAAELIGTALTKDLSTEMIGGFTGTFIGMEASGNGSKNTHPADFDWFDFEEDPITPFEWMLGIKDRQNNIETPGIISTSAITDSKAKIVWNNIPNETGYLIERYGIEQFDSVGTTNANDTVFNDSGLKGNTLYQYRIVGKNNNLKSHPSVTASVLTLPTPGPYSGTAEPIPGKIEVENYDTGSNGVSFYDTDAGNNLGKYRTDAVDIESSSDSENAFNIGSINDGEWLLYTVDVNDTLVDLEIRFASVRGGRIKIELDGQEIAKVNLPVSGGWQIWKTTTIKNVKLEKGLNKKLKLTILSGGFNLNWINFVKGIPTGIHENKSSDIGVYPNPASNQIKIKSLDFKYSTIEIFNHIGACVLTEAIHYQPENLFQLSLPDGQYILSLSNSKQKKTLKLNVIQ